MLTFLIEHFFFLGNISTIEVQSNKQLYDFLMNGTLKRKEVMPRDKPKLNAPFYEKVEIAYDLQDRYVPKTFICKQCSQAMYVPVEGGNSKLRSHKCVKKFLTNEQEGDDGDYYVSGLLSEYQTDILSKYFAEMSKATFQTGQISSETIKGILPKDWRPHHW